MTQYIFCEILEDSKVKGLIDCWDGLELDGMFCVIADEWKKMTEKGEAFVAYFEQHKLSVIANCMTSELRTAAGLGYPPDVYMQNANECVNSILKRAAKGRKLTLREAAHTIESCLREPENQVKLVMIGAGELRVAQNYSQFSIPQDNFYGMSVLQRERALKHFNEA